MGEEEIINLYLQGYSIDEIIDLCIKNIRLKKINKIVDSFF